MTKYIFISGGVCSGLGKGVASASIGSLLEGAGIEVTMVKCDPYINLDAGTMNPYQNGEVYVTADGGETDADLGTFARFTSFSPTKEHSITTGQIYEAVIRNERAGRYNGRTVQVIPHVTDEIKRRILECAMGRDRFAFAQEDADKAEDHVVIVEIGGTVGDIESIPYLEAMRQLIRELGKTDALSIYLTLVPVLAGGEMKTKPTQHAVKKMQESGIQPDILLCRCEVPLEEDLRKKIALFCNVDTGSVFTTIDVKRSIYELPVLFHQQGLDRKILDRLGFADKKVNIRPWISFVTKLESPQKQVTIALVGKTDLLDDCYKSIREAVLHAAVTAHHVDARIRRIDAEELEKSAEEAVFFDGVQGIIVPDNFGQRGFLGLLAAIRYAREHRIPYLGIDLGMQLMSVEIARNLLGWEDADSTEFRRTSHPVVSLPEEQGGGMSSSGFFKLGLAGINLEKNTKLYDIYRKKRISERHRNKYTFNRRFAREITERGLQVTAFAQDKQAEAFEWEGHPWGIGVQYHPEFSSRPLKPHPLFSGFIEAALQTLQYELL